MVKRLSLALRKPKNGKKLPKKQAEEDFDDESLDGFVEGEN